MAEAYGARPSELMGMETPWGAWQLDQVTLIVGRQVEKELIDGKQPGSTTASAQKTEEFKDPRALKSVQTVKLKPDGTW